MGKRSRRQRGGLPGTLPGSVASRRGKVNSSPSASTLSPERRAAAISAAEAECWAALESAASDGITTAETAETTPRLFQANLALVDAISLDDDDRRTMAEYFSRTVLRRGVDRTAAKSIRATMRWPRIRKYYPRLRRRICWGCGKEYDLSEPRLWVCAGCGEARYCNAACQREHWPAHERPCWEKFVEKGRERRSQGESMEKIRQEYNEWYPASQLWGNP